MTDRELLEKAAKAAGYRVGRDPSGAPSEGRWDLYWDVRENALVWHGRQGGHEWPEVVTWDPLTDDGDALRLAVKTGVLDGRGFQNEWNALYSVNRLPADRCEAYRLCIVRAAAAVGKGDGNVR